MYMSVLPMASGDSITTHYKGALSVVPGVLAGREHYPCRKFPLNSCKSLLFHGGDTGSIPVRDANMSIIYKESHLRRGSK